MENMKDSVRIQGEGFLNSYVQVFFSENRWFGLILLAVSFLDVYAGLAGAVAVVTANLTAKAMGYDPWFIRKGYYGYNSLLVGLGFGLTFEPGLAFFTLLVVAALLTFLLTIAVQGFLYKYGLPFLSIPFILGIWILLLASSGFGELGLSGRGVFVHNEWYALGGNWLIGWLGWFDGLITSPFIRTWLFSMGAIFFQYNLLAGALIAFGLLLFSRIAFSLSLLGFFLAWLFYSLTGADITALGYSYIGFNYILTSIAAGGIFIIPSRWSYLWLVWLLPMVVMVTLGLQRLFTVFQLGLYALPFNVVVMTFLYVLKIRVHPGGRLTEVAVQQFSPEKNLYQSSINAERFPAPGELPIGLPVMGTWTVSQAYEGEHTHKGEWRHALDFVITDPQGRQYRGEGNRCEEYHCFAKPVVAPADGVVADLLDGIADNPIGDINTRQNWGNTVVIRHADHIFTQLSHLKSGSLKVKKGDSVKKGDIIGLCGNSGRSPYPHLHFQVQATPHIGSRTLHYPLAHYLTVGGGSTDAGTNTGTGTAVNADNNTVKNTGSGTAASAGNNTVRNVGTKTVASSAFGIRLKANAIPGRDERVMAIRNHPLPEKAFHFIPGRQMSFSVKGSGRPWLDGDHQWEAGTDEYNNGYLECRRTGARAWFYNNGEIHWFVNYTGNRKSLLYYFYLGCYQVLTGHYPNLVITDRIPPNLVFPWYHMAWHDVVAPFRMILKVNYEMTYTELADDFHASTARLHSVVTAGKSRHWEFGIHLAGGGIERFTVKEKNNQWEAICTG